MRSQYRDLLKELKPLLDAGMPLRDALASLRQNRGSGSLAAALAADVEAGKSLGEAMRDVRPRLPREHAALVTAAEQAGRLTEILGKLALDLDNRLEAQRTLVVRATYPVVVLALVVLLPPLYLVFLGQEMEYVKYQLSVFAPLALIALLLWRGPRLIPRESGARLVLERSLLVVPGLRRMVLEDQWGRAFSLLGMLLDGGLPLSESLPLTADAATWRVVSDDLNRVDRAIREGGTCTDGFAALGRVPDSALSRLAAAERAGGIDREFTRLGRELESSFRWRLQIILRTLPIVLYLFAAYLVLKYALSVLAP